MPSSSRSPRPARSGAPPTARRPSRWPSSRAPNGAGLIVEADDTLLGQPIQIKADLVVLATGMVPATKDDPVINLAYRQGPAFRDNALFNDYADSNHICFPYETQRTGIYAAGAIRRSLSTEESMEAAT